VFYQYMYVNFKIIWSYTTVNLLEVLAVFLATCLHVHLLVLFTAPTSVHVNHSKD